MWICIGTLQRAPQKKSQGITAIALGADSYFEAWLPRCVIILNLKTCSGELKVDVGIDIPDCRMEGNMHQAKSSKEYMYMK